MWLQALRAARRLTNEELPSASTPNDGPPPTNRWSDRDPAAAARLTAARAALNAIAEEHSLPVENLLLPDLVRRTCWTPPEEISTASIADLLRTKGAREWQIGLVGVPLTEALTVTAPDTIG